MPCNFPWQRFSRIARKKTVSGSMVQALLRSRFSGATWTSSTRSSSRQMISSRFAAVAMFGGMMKRTSIGVPRFSERVRDFRRGPVGAVAAGWAAAIFVVALAGASSRSDRAGAGAAVAFTGSAGLR